MSHPVALDQHVGIAQPVLRVGAIERILSIPGADPDQGVVAGDALWIADEAGHRILRVDTADLSQ